jgi:hypothetical protein
MEESGDVDVKQVEQKFSVLFLSLRTRGVRDYLGLDMSAEPAQARRPVQKDNLPKLSNLARWLFGDAEHAPVLRDSREIDEFGGVLASDEGRAYLERTEKPRLEVALQKSGVGLDDLVQLIDIASDNVEVTLMKAHFYKDAAHLERAARRLSAGVDRLMTLFADKN